VKPNSERQGRGIVQGLYGRRALHDLCLNQQAS
jgi:hypothetical protein